MLKSRTNMLSVGIRRQPLEFSNSCVLTKSMASTVFMSQKLGVESGFTLEVQHKGPIPSMRIIELELGYTLTGCDVIEWYSW